MTTKADTSVKWFHSEMVDAPVLSGQVGKLIELLDACLINGFSVRTPDSIVVSEGVATVSISAGNPYGVDEVIQLSGASNANLNSEWRISVATANSFSFVCPGVTDGVVTGVSAKRAPVGYWEKVFSGTNTAVYKSSHPNYSGFLLRINDTDARFPRVRAYESMTGVDTGINPFPVFATVADDNFVWPKVNVTSGTRKWAVIGDGLFFYFLPAFSATTPDAYDTTYFGQIARVATSDIYACAIAAEQNAAPSSVQSSLYSTNATSMPNGVWYARSFNSGSPTPIHAAHRGFSTSSGDTNAVPLDGKVRFCPLFALNGSSSSHAIRGEVPGLRLSYERASGPPATRTIGLAGRTHFLYRSSASLDTIHTAIDVTGPWR